jgi:hypothetical protein
VETALLVVLAAMTALLVPVARHLAHESR